MLRGKYFILENYDPAVVDRFFEDYRILSERMEITVYDSNHPITRTPQSIMLVEKEILSQIIDAHLESPSGVELKVRTSDK